MNKVSRPYRPGDEAQINRLYAMVTGRERTPEQYAWEWLETWDGRGSIDLLFDLDRPEGDQLIAQYSLIPTPLSVFGKPTVAGKTENCMSHPDHWRTGLYLPHEQEWFEKEKARYSFFFTTAGQVSHGAVGKIRRKLGYVAFDNWVRYTLWLRSGTLRDELRAIAAAKGAVGRALAPAFAGLGTAALQGVSRLRRRRRCGYRTATHKAGEAPLGEIEALWSANREAYGITVDRSTAYLSWRIDRDPYLEHEYLTMWDEGRGGGAAREGGGADRGGVRSGPAGGATGGAAAGRGRLLGYAVYYERHGILSIVDIVVDGRSGPLYRHLLAALTERGRQRGVEKITCLTLRRSRPLARCLRSAGFLNKGILSPAAFRRSFRPRQFFLYVPEELRDDPRVTDHDSWYVTELVLEGRDYDRGAD